MIPPDLVLLSICPGRQFDLTAVLFCCSLVAALMCWISCSIRYQGSTERVGRFQLRVHVQLQPKSKHPYGNLRCVCETVFFSGIFCEDVENLCA